MIGIGIDIYPETNILGYFEDIEGIEGENPLEIQEETEDDFPKRYRLKLLKGKDFGDFQRKLDEVLVDNESNGYIYLVDHQKNIKQACFFSGLEIADKQDLENGYYNLSIDCFLHPANKGVREVWKMRINKQLTEYNLWRKLEKESRQGWLAVAINFQNNIIDRENLNIEINGDLIDDLDSFFCVLGEGINGPGGYFGRNFNALDDCFCGDFGVKQPFTLQWKNHLKSKENLKETFDEIIEVLKYNEAKIELK